MLSDSISSCLRNISGLLEKKGVGRPSLTARQIIARYTGIPPLELELHKHRLLSEDEQQFILQAVQRKCLNEPLQYIFGEVCFMGLDFLINKNALIPRQETELLVEKIIRDNEGDISLLDLGTGSGNIAISLAKLCPDWRISASDISGDALKIAAINAARHQVAISFHHSDLFDNITHNYDIIVSNPPYIPEKEYNKLDREIRFFEPKTALIADDNGFYYYRKIMQEAISYLNPPGWLYFEIGYNQGEGIRRLAKELNYRVVDIIRDYQQFERIVKLTPRDR